MKRRKTMTCGIHPVLNARMVVVVGAKNLLPVSKAITGRELFLASRTRRDLGTTSTRAILELARKQTTRNLGSRRCQTRLKEEPRVAKMGETVSS